MDHQMIENCSGAEIMPEEGQEWRVLKTGINVGENGKLTTLYLVELAND